VKVRMCIKMCVRAHIKDVCFWWDLQKSGNLTHFFMKQCALYWIHGQNSANRPIKKRLKLKIPFKFVYSYSLIDDLNKIKVVFYPQKLCYTNVQSRSDMWMEAQWLSGVCNSLSHKSTRLCMERTLIKFTCWIDTWNSKPKLWWI